MQIEHLVRAMANTIEEHKLGSGSYARWLWQNEAGTRKMGANEYGCADAANILYTIGQLPKGPAERADCVRVLQGFQDPRSGLFFEGTHHAIHCTAHCTAALELFDAQPLYPVKALEACRTQQGLEEFLTGLDWLNAPWPQAHQGAGIFAAFILTGWGTPEWQDWYFGWLDRNTDEQHGMSPKGAIAAGPEPAAHHLFGWFHYLFNYSFARRPYPQAEKLVETCLELYADHALDDDFGVEVNFREIDWVYALNRASLQTGYRIREARAQLRDFAKKYVDYLSSIDYSKHEGWNDLHALFGTSCALAELQQALPGELRTDYPLKLVLDRRPFI